MQVLQNHFIKKQSFLYLPDTDIVKVVIEVNEITRSCVLKQGTHEWKECYNILEPFDFATHVFFIHQNDFHTGAFTMTVQRYKKRTNQSAFFAEGEFEGIVEFVLHDTDIQDFNLCMKAYDSQIPLPAVPVEQETLEGNVEYAQYETNNRFGEPVKFFTLRINPSFATIVTGTPNDAFVSGYVKQTVCQEAEAAIKNGKKVVAATNADFFDMNGDQRPSGLCIKEGVVIDNPDSVRPFIGVMRTGEFVISSAEKTHSCIEDLQNAVCGSHIVLENGKIADIAPLESFGYVKHPRTAAGITKEGGLILLIVDGRIPEYSNGATLVDIALLMKQLGAVTAVNLDGGGSSTMLIKDKTTGKFDVRNVPADLYHPFDRLIRNLYDSILVVAK
ncbi:MAG: phosphodiester glycosidase family protein [Clostridia bacterium]|nr:phosphodiester glycosidase family protein [Clostridia bacterium]